MDEGCKVAKVFLGKKESKEEEKGESIFLVSSEEEEGESIFLVSSEEEEGEQESYLMAIKKNLDPYFLLKIDLMLIFFSPKVSFFEELIFFDANFFSFSNEIWTE